jgi:osmoprotectant transport system substrate-binding protein
MTRKIRGLWAVLAVLALLAGACGDDSGDEEGSGSGGGEPTEVPDGPTITIGTQDFGESSILGQIYGQALANAGYEVEYQELGGFRDLEVPAFESGDINFAPEYLSSMLEFLNEFAGEASADVEATKGLLDEALAEIGLQALEPAPGQNRNTFVVAGDSDLTAISELTEDLVLGAPQDCETNAFCLPGLADVYGIDLSANFTPLDTGVIPAALDEGEIDVAVLFSTDGIILENGYVQLEDDEGLFNAENIVPVVSDELAEAHGEDMVALVNEVSATLTTEALTEMNARNQIDVEDPDVIAADFLADNGLG